MKLVVEQGERAGQVLALARPALHIGRGKENDIVLVEADVSREHARLQRGPQGWTLVDLGTTNGTFVNGKRLPARDPYLLRPGDRITIGTSVLAVQEDAAPEQASRHRRRVHPVILLAGTLAFVLLLVGIVALLVAILKPAEPVATPTTIDQDEQPTAGVTVQPIVVLPTETPLPAGPGQATGTPPVDLPATGLLPTVEVQVTRATAVPAAPPVSAQQLEQLPEVVTQYLGDVPPEQLGQVLAAQIQSMPREQVGEMINALFPGIDPDRLLPVVAASFPDMPEAEIQGLLDLVYPGGNLSVPGAGAIGGRLVLGIYDKAADRHDVYLANASGGQPMCLVQSASGPDFAPDGQWVVYFSWASDRPGLHLIKTDGSGDTQLTSVREHGYPTCSPDGGRISFYHNETKILHTINRDGSGQRDIGQGEFPAWSPTGDLIAYRGCMGSGKCGLIVANADGSNPRQITTHANDAAPRWSPNGGQIAFHSDRDGNWEIYVINLDGSWLRRITMSPSTDVMPVWSPDGLRIAFRSDRGGQGAVWVTSGIGGPAFKILDAGFDPACPELAQMDWSD